MNLAASSAIFVGREAELDEIARLLSDPACRLLTLVGLGGIGKTRLALEAARQLPDARFVPLQPLTSPELIITAIADAVGFQFYSGSDPKQQLLDYLREKSLLLVLDNFEHLLDGATLLSEILAAAPDLRLLVTSRERLNLTEEWTLDVGGLAYPPDENDGDLEQYSAVALFVQHARRAKVSFALTDDNRSAVARICRLVGGMPLALELAANWVRTLSCEAIADEIAHSLDILETPARNVEPRHRTMRAAFEPTWERLTDHQRDVFMRLSVFRGGFTREAAKEVAGASLRTLSALVDKALVRVDAAGRYDLHELLRQYAADKLGEAGEAKQLSKNHAEHFRELAEQFEAHIYGPDQLVWLNRMNVERDNIRAALDWSLQMREIETGLRLASALRPFWEYRDHLLEGIDWLERLFAVTEVVVSPQWRRTALNRLGDMAGLWRIENKCSALCLEALALARQADDRRNIGWALVSLGHWMIVSYPPDQRAQLLDESLLIFREINDPYGLSHALRRRGWLAILQRQYPTAQSLLEESLLRSRSAGDRIAPAWTLFMLGELARRYNPDLARSAALYGESQVLFEEIQDYDGAENATLGLARLALLAAHHEQAETLYRHALRLQEKMHLNGDRSGISPHILVGLGLLAARQGRMERAARLLSRMDPSYRSINYFGFEEFSGEMESVWERFAEPALAAAWHEGKAMTGEQVFAYALQGENTPELDPAKLSAAWAEGRSMTLEQAAAAALEEPNARIEAQPDQQAESTQTAPIELLNSRETEVLRLMADGLSNGEIADQLFLAKSTIKWYVRQLFSKLDATSRTQAVARGRALGLLH